MNYYIDHSAIRKVGKFIIYDANVGSKKEIIVNTKRAICVAD